MALAKLLQYLSMDDMSTVVFSSMSHSNGEGQIEVTEVTEFISSVAVHRG